MTQRIEGYRAVHGARIYINITYFLGKILCHRTLTARRVSVYCYCYFLHNFELTLMYNL
ncbi:Uncharacterised protein [Segatella copri]|nr:Uncharacterised protein [Segatella copri]